MRYLSAINAGGRPAWWRFAQTKLIKKLVRAVSVPGLWFSTQLGRPAQSHLT
jgi:hypothetical protein